MRSRWNCLVVGSCNVLGLALLVLSATGGGSAVRAEDPAASPGSVLEKIVTGIEQRVADLQASVAAFADSFTATRIAAQELCVGDSNGAQTCITKAQLDALLRTTVQTGQAPAAIEPDQTEQTASADKSTIPLALAVPPPDAPAATEPAAQAGEGRGGEAAAAVPEVAAVPDPEVAAAREVETAPAVPTVPEAAAAAEADAVPGLAVREAEAVPETTAAIAPAMQPTTGQQAAASSEAAAPLVAEAIVPSQPSGPADSIIVEELKVEDPAPHGSTETTSAPPEVKAAPAEAAPVSQRAE
jgi:hypothetical protein